MTAAIRTYLLSVTAVAMAAGLVLALVPRGAVWRALQMLCGMAVVLTAVGPLLQTDPDAIAQELSRMALGSDRELTQLQENDPTLLVSIIKEKAESYIWDKAEAQGIRLTGVTVEIAVDGEVPYPCAVALVGQWTPEQRKQLSALLERELAIMEENQEWYADERP